MEAARLTDQGEVKRFIDKLLQASPAAQTEVMVTEWDSALTRFANNGIHQNVAERDVSVRVRVAKDGKTGVASINQMNEAAAADVLKRAITIADLQAKGEVVPMPGPAKSQPVEAWSDATAGATPEERADFVEAICAKAKRAGLNAFGAFSTGAEQFTIANSLGVYHHHRSTEATINSVVMGDAGSGYADRGAINVQDLDKDEVADEVIDKAQRNQNAQPIEPGVYEVVLEEYAVAEMLDFLNYTGFSALAVEEERSFMRLGERITGEGVTIWDDGLDPSGLPSPFDFEGVPKQRVDLIKKGVATGVVYDMMTATKEGRQSTGHGLPAPNTEGPFAVNLFMQPGSFAKPDLVSGIKRGIWVTRFWYVRTVHPKLSIITGMTRDGTFLIENGKVSRPVKDLRFTQSILQALDGTVAVGKTTKLQIGEFIGASRVPALHLKAFTFTS